MQINQVAATGRSHAVQRMPEHMKQLITILACLPVMSFMAGCAFKIDTQPVATERNMTVGAALALFSDNAPEGVPQGWLPITLAPTKKSTRYQLTADGGKTVLHAHAVGAASALMQEVSVDLSEQAWLQWRWKVDRLLERSNNFNRDTEDSPVRIVLAFDGDKSTLPFTEQVMFETGRMISGHEPAYATLMYIWERTAPIDTIITNSRTGRIKKVVAASGKADIGKWRTLSRDIVADFKTAYGEKPGRLIGVGVMTDTDNTGETIEAWYGDIEFLKGPM